MARVAARAVDERPSHHISAIAPLQFNYFGIQKKNLHRPTITALFSTLYPTSVYVVLISDSRRTCYTAIGFRVFISSLELGIAIVSLGTKVVSSVAVYPGLTELARANRTHSTARHLVRCRTPAFAAL